MRASGVLGPQLVAATEELPQVTASEVKHGFMLQRLSQPMAERVPTWEGRSRVTLRADDDETRKVAKQAWDAIAPQEEDPILFRFSVDLAWVEATRTSEPRVITATKERLTFVHSRHISWLYKMGKGDKEVEPPSRVIDDQLANPHPPVPMLTGVRSTPIFGPSGSLVNAAGYDSESCYFLWPAKLKIPFVPRHPTAADVAKARYILCTEVLVDFPFEDDSSLAHAIAGMLQPFVRPMIHGPTPLHLIAKPTPGTGGTLLAEVVAIPALGRSPSPMTAGKLEDEWRFRIFGTLMDAPAVVLLDNLNKRLDSAAFASVLTATTFKDRKIRSSTVLVVPVQCLWLATGNNPSLSDELGRRAVPIFLDANVERPEERSEFRHDDLKQWSLEHRSDIIWSLLVLVQCWIDRGRPRPDRRMGSYESWSDVVGGILKVSGFEGFLDNRSRLQDDSLAEMQAWRTLVEIWHERFGGSPVRSSDVHALVPEEMAELLGLGADGSRSRSTKWGELLATKRGCVLAGYKVLRAPSKQGFAMWRLESVGAAREEKGQ